ncbi:astacin-like isoform X2 [Clytia hemisphaerica]|uniref:astacin-like isoform X2 n=1 Tax=Clytia hemisphaerica TaxID=252671 RepID=UPI0034D5E995
MSTEDVEKLLSQRERKRREVVSSTLLLWPNGVVPYNFSNGFPYEKQVKEAMREVERLTCIRFVPRTTQRGYVEFIRGYGCYSEIGYKRRQQRISIGSGYQWKGVIIHEILHAVGFYHEQSRLDRDQYLHINWDNIDTRNKRNFQKYDRGVAVMQYGNYAFAINIRLMTIVSKSDAKERLGQRRGMSSSDIRQLNMRYGCGDVTPPPTTTTTVDPSCVDKERYCKRSDIDLYCHKSFMVRDSCQRSCNNCPQKPATTTSKIITTPTTTSTTPATTTTTPKTTTTAPTTTTTTTTSTTTSPTTTIPTTTTTTTARTTTRHNSNRPPLLLKRRPSLLL